MDQLERGKGPDSRTMSVVRDMLAQSVKSQHDKWETTSRWDWVVRACTRLTHGLKGDCFQITFLKVGGHVIKKIGFECGFQSTQLAPLHRGRVSPTCGAKRTRARGSKFQDMQEVSIRRTSCTAAVAAVVRIVRWKCTTACVTRRVREQPSTTIRWRIVARHPPEVTWIPIVPERPGPNCFDPARRMSSSATSSRRPVPPSPSWRSRTREAQRRPRAPSKPR